MPIPTTEIVDLPKTSGASRPFLIARRCGFIALAALILLGLGGCQIQLNGYAGGRRFHKTIYVGMQKPAPVVRERINTYAQREGLSDKQTRLAQNILLAAAAQGLANSASQGDDFISQSVTILARQGRTALLMDILRDLAPPNTDPLAIRMAARGLGQILDGSFTVKDFAEANARNEIIFWVKENAPELATEADVINFFILLGRMRSAPAT